MFKVGDKVVYPMHGAGKIQSIEERAIGDEIQSYYIIKMPGEVKVMVPTAKAEANGLRYIIDKETAGKVTSTDSMKEMDMFYNKGSESIYDGIYHQVLDIQPLLLRTAKEWIKIRKGLLTAKKSSKHESSSDCITSVMLDRMAKTIEESSSDE